MNAVLLYVSIALHVLIVLVLNFFRGKNKPQPTTAVTADPFWAKTRNNPHYVPPSQGAPASASPPSTTTRFNTGPLSGTRPLTNTSGSTNKGDSSFWAKTRNNPHYVPPTATVSIPSTTTRFNASPMSGTQPQTASPVTSKTGDSFWAKTRNNPHYVVPTSARLQATPSVTINVANLSASSDATSGTSQVTPSVPAIAFTSSSPSPQIFITSAPFLPSPPPSANTQNPSVPALQDIQLSSHPRPTFVTTMQDEPASETRI